MGDAQNSQENFDKAIQLYSAMEAPKQVEKVQRAIAIPEWNQRDRIPERQSE